MLYILHAVAGAGKTTFIVRRILEEIKRNKGGRYMVISFQKADRLNFLRRLEAWADAVIVRGNVWRGITRAEVMVEGFKGEVHITNLHSLAYHILRSRNPESAVVVLDNNKVFWQDFLKGYERDWQADITHEFPEGLGDLMLALYNYGMNKIGYVSFDEIRKSVEGQAILEGYKYIANKSIGYADFHKFLQDMEKARTEFRRFLIGKMEREVVAVFFTELIPYLNFLSVVDYTAIFVDEVQDIPAFAFQYFVKWAKNCDVFVVGDVNQRIFVWYGTDEDFVETLQKMAKTEGVAVRTANLDLTLRLPDWTNGYLKSYQRRAVDIKYKKFGISRYGDSVYYGSLLILVRNRVFFRNFKTYTDFSRRFVVLTLDEAEELEYAKRCFERILQERASEQDYKSVQKFLKINNKRGTFNLSEADEVRLRLLKGEIPYATISTVHGAKGREASNVVIYNRATKNTRTLISMFPKLEQTVYYVALTRHSATFKIVSDDTTKAWFM